MGGVVSGTPQLLAPRKGKRYAFYWRLGGRQSKSRRVRKIRTHWDSIPESSSRSELLNRLRYPGRTSKYNKVVLLPVSAYLHHAAIMFGVSLSTQETFEL
jgi:hypothetical protein